MYELVVSARARRIRKAANAPASDVVAARRIAFVNAASNCVCEWPNCAKQTLAPGGNCSAFTVVFFIAALRSPKKVPAPSLRGLPGLRFGMP